MGACEPLPISGTRIDVELLVKTVREQENMQTSSQYMVQVCTRALQCREAGLRCFYKSSCVALHQVQLGARGFDKLR